MSNFFAYVLLGGAWLIVVFRIPWVLPPNQPNKWRLFILFILYALFLTCRLPVSYEYLLWIFSPAAIYVFSSISLCGICITLVTYLTHSKLALLTQQLHNDLGMIRPIPGLALIRTSLVWGAFISICLRQQ